MASDLPVDAFQAKLAKLRAGFIERLITDAAEFEMLAGRLLGPDADEEDRQSVKRMAHRLAGASGTFGFQDLSQPAAAVEDLAGSGCTNAELGRRSQELAQLILRFVPAPAAQEEATPVADPAAPVLNRSLG